MPELMSLADRKVPSMPTEHALRKTLRRIQAKLTGAAEEVLQQEGLERASLRGLDDAAARSGVSLDALAGDDLREWAGDPEPRCWLKVIVIPPCDPDDIVGTWAQAAGHCVVAPALRHLRAGDEVDSRLNLGGDGVIVIPRLEDWFLRRREGLAPVRSLLVRLAGLERHAVVGCNPWAWRFLVTAVGADALLPPPLTFAATGASALRERFAGMAVDDEGRPLTFRLARTGEDVLAANGVDDAPSSGHLRQLAARSFGIPWVAGALWRASLRVRTRSDDLPARAIEATEGDERTVWVADVDDCKLPRGYEDRSLLALQALLIHDALTESELDSVLPATGEPGLVPALVAAGFIRREARGLRVRAAAYPALRRALQADGFPLGAI